jgi:hypothetical protein
MMVTQEKEKKFFLSPLIFYVTEVSLKNWLKVFPTNALCREILMKSNESNSENIVLLILFSRLLTLNAILKKLNY